MDQKRVTFTKRPTNIPLARARNHTAGTDLGDTIRVGDDWTLKIFPESLQVTIVTVSGNNKFEGRIDCFESRTDNEYMGYKVGEIVDFEETDVWPVSNEESNKDIKNEELK